MRNLMRLLMLCFLLLTNYFVLSDEDDDLISVPVQPCDIIKACGRCPREKEGEKECQVTGFIQQVKCIDQANSTNGLTTYLVKQEPCSPTNTDAWREMCAFNIFMFLCALISLCYVRKRKNLARQDLVSLVNRS